MKIVKPKTIKEVRRFLGMVQYYHDLWKKCIHMLELLIELTGDKKTNKFEWNESCRKVFESTKKLLAIFSERFVLYMYTSNLQLGVVVFQEGQLITYYSRKVNSSQCTNTTT